MNTRDEAGSRERGAGLLVLLSAVMLSCGPLHAQPLPQIGSLPRGGGGGTPVGTNIFTGTNATSQFVTNVILSLDLWTNDTDGFVTYIRPVDRARSLQHVQMSSNYWGFYQENQVTNNQTFTITHWIVAKTTNSAAKGPYYWDGSYGGLFESDPELSAVKAGDGVGLLGVSDSWWSRQIGLAGYAEAQGNNQTNIGMHAAASSNGKSGAVRVGLYAETGVGTRAAVTDHPMTSGVIVGDSRATGDALLVLSTNNGTVLVQVNAAGDPVIANNAAAGRVLMSVDANGVGKWQTLGPLLWYTNATDGSIVNTNQLAGKVSIGTSVGTTPAAIIADISTNTIFIGSSNGTEVFKINKFGDLSTIKSTTYTWPTARGGAGAVLTDLNNGGGLVWTNLSLSLGPGTNNFLAKFDSTTTNVQGSILYSDTSNNIEARQSFNPSISYTNSLTNRIGYGEWTNVGTNQWVELVVPKGHNNEAAHFRVMAIGQTGQRAPLLIQDAVTIEPITNQFGGHGAGDLYPNTGSAGVGLQSLGHQNLPWLDVWASRVFAGTGLSSGPQWGSGVGGTGMGLTTDNTMIQFFRDTGITMAFNKERNSGQLMADFAGNGIGMGTGMSNIICGFLTSGLVGLVQVSVTNSSTATPGTHGIMGVQGSGTDKGGGDVRLVGGPSTGIGTNGNVRLQTAEKALSTSSSLNSSFKDRLFVIADPIILATNVATLVFNFTIPTALKGAGGTVFAHTEIENGVDMAATDESFSITALRKGSTVTCTNSVVVPSSYLATGSASLTNTWTVVANSQSVDVKLAAVTAGILSTNSTTRVTFIPNSSAVPVITHP